MKDIRLILSGFIAIIIFAYYLFVPAWRNDETATIENVGKNYQITLTGQRVYMVHDPISALSRDTYLETYKFNIPRAKGVIKGEEITFEEEAYQLHGEEIHLEEEAYQLHGKINLNQDKLTIDLYEENYENKTKDPFGWNGTYKLLRKGYN